MGAQLTMVLRRSPVLEVIVSIGVHGFLVRCNLGSFHCENAGIGLAYGDALEAKIDYDRSSFNSVEVFKI
jgi:hypothetical protein